MPQDNELAISFQSPTLPGYRYIGRNHAFTEALAQYVINQALQRGERQRAARCSVIRSPMVKERTILFQLRVRNVIAEQPSNKEIVAEEMSLWGYRGPLEAPLLLEPLEAMSLLMDAVPTELMEKPEQVYWLNDEIGWIYDEVIFRSHTDAVALARATHLVESHTKFKKLVSGNKYKVVEPVLPMDVLGVYIFLPPIR